MVATDIARILIELDGGRAAADLENQTLEVKQDKRVPEDTERDIAEAAVCLANGSGGTIVVGISDRPGATGSLLGTGLAIDHLRQSVYASTSPGLLVEVQELVHRSARLLVVRVPEGLDVYADSKGRPYQRIGNQCQPMPVAEAARLREERLGHDWSAETADRSPDEISAATFETVRSVLSTLPDDRRQLVTLSDLDLLRALDLLSGEALNRAGELLLLPAIAARPRLLYQFRPTPGGEPTFAERLDAPLVSTFGRVMEVVRARLNSAPLNLPDGQQIQLQDFPEQAVREAIANGLVHRDYRLAGTVAIEHSPAVLSVTSPGPLVAGVTPENSTWTPILPPRWMY